MAIELNGANEETVGPIRQALLAAPLASPVFTGTPVVPAPTNTDSSTQIATTGFVKATSEPLPWMIPGCLGAYDWRDVTLNSTKITQWNDKSGNGKHLTHATDSTRQVTTTTGAWGKGGVYDVADGGITAVNSRSFTAVWIGTDFGVEDPNSGMTSTNGSVYLPSTSIPRMRWDSNYGISASGEGIWGPGAVFSPSTGPTMYAQVFSSTESMFFTGGFRSAKSALTQTTSTITKVFGQHDGGGAFYRKTQGLYFFSRPLTMAELLIIGNYYGAQVTPVPQTVYCFGSSTPNGQGSAAFQNGCIQLFADAIGASRATWSVGGAGWNESANAMATAGAFNTHRGSQGIHIVMPTSNNLAAHVSVATCETAIANHIARVLAADPMAWIILCPIAPRNASFTGGQTYDDFDVDRLALNASMEATAAATAGIVYADAMTIPDLGDKGDEANTTYFDPDKLHLNAAGHRAYAKSIFRAWLTLHTGV